MKEKGIGISLFLIIFLCFSGMAEAMEYAMFQNMTGETVQLCVCEKFTQKTIWKGWLGEEKKKMIKTRRLGEGGVEYKIRYRLKDRSLSNWSRSQWKFTTNKLKEAKKRVEQIKFLPYKP